MFARLYGWKTLKEMRRRLHTMSPEPELWNEIYAYLAHGKRIRGQGAGEVMGLYIKMRDKLGMAASFRNGAPLSITALAEPCRSLLCGDKTDPFRDQGRLAHWAGFCLAADYLLALAYEADVQKGKIGKAKAAETWKRFDQTRRDFLDHIGPKWLAPEQPEPVASGINKAAAA